MTDLVLLRPYWLLALPVLAALAFWLMRRPVALGAWRAAVDPELMAAMIRIGRVPETRSGAGLLLPLIASGFAVLALSGPAVERRDAPSFRNLDGVVVVLDISPSVTEDGHLAALQTAARILLNSIGSRPAALIVYAGDAYLAAPITTDTRQIGLTVSLLEAGIVPNTGTRPALALSRAQTLLTEAEIVAGDVVLFSDGGGLDGAATRIAGGLKQTGARLWTVAPDSPGPGMAALADAGGGAAFSASEAVALSDAVAAGRAARLAATDIVMLYLNDLGRWLLVPALIATALLFRRAA